MRQINKGFTLIELMIVIFLIAIIVAIAIPSYQHFALKSDEAAAQQRIQRIAADLELYKARQFNYAGYSLPSELAQYPDATNPKYSFAVYDSVKTSKGLDDDDVAGRGWIITASSNSNFPKLHNYIMTSSGKSCMQPQGESLKLNCQGAAAWSK